MRLRHRSQIFPITYVQIPRIVCCWMALHIRIVLYYTYIILYNRVCVCGVVRVGALVRQKCEKIEQTNGKLTQIFANDVFPGYECGRTNANESISINKQSCCFAVTLQCFQFCLTHIILRTYVHMYIYTYVLFVLYHITFPTFVLTSAYK